MAVACHTVDTVSMYVEFIDLLEVHAPMQILTLIF